MKKTPFFVLCVLSLVPALSACQPTVATRGNLVEPDLLAQIKPGVSTREDVANKLGTPTQIASFDEKKWYYIGRQTEQYSFFDPEVIKQQAIEVAFDDSGIVTKVQNLDLSKAGDVTPVGRETPTYGRNDTLLRELLGDLNHPMPNLKDMGR